MRYKILISLFIFMFFLFGIGITYSCFNSTSELSTVDQKIAKFIIDTQSLDRLELPLFGMVPGQSEEYNFSVGNSSLNVSSDVTISYQLTILTPHFSPLVIELYKGDELILTCDETYSRNENNELVCNSSVLELSHDDENVDDFTLSITFDGLYNDESYSNLVDYINIGIRSYQKV